MTKDYTDQLMTSHKRGERRATYIKRAIKSETIKKADKKKNNAKKGRKK